MNQEVINTRHSERGGAGVKVLFVLVVLGLIGNAGINFIPVWYDGQHLAQEMDSAVAQAMSNPEFKKPVPTLKTRFEQMKKTNIIPSDALIQVKEVKGVLQANIRYVRKIDIIPFGLYQYDYFFNHTAMPGGKMRAK